MMYFDASSGMEDLGLRRFDQTAQLVLGLLVLADVGVFIFTIILLCAGIPVPEFRTAVIVLLVSSLVSQVTRALVRGTKSQLLAAAATIVSIALAAAALALCCVNWNMALSRSDEWAIGIGNISIPDGANPELWVLVHGTRYGNVVIALAALQLATVVVNAVVGIVCIVVLHKFADDLIAAFS
ncbi:hypothetical protein MAPG_05147 [Magnaporthiopsis poae ATCC 64411]|uniref:Uncharacterized protein n=1 Tax=Magnaporthiopsis poae (strain ATCC 64411 / 73-15) TaxID=644358 RepID=A0A0C4DYM1_MAGP6|nr:hypothetical protein MAPG_05147 [Magnaporthiopsis poae ATCC 64411]